MKVREDLVCQCYSDQVVPNTFKIKDEVNNKNKALNLEWNQQAHMGLVFTCTQTFGLRMYV